ncbi:hypothetical protein T440DRAFT_472252 [Plenodomus tracheiphilus IPT5]|uniref:Uncharacterized protein n=1 Tax=Plenodomus tracheiphilus IPT5 TaxID=1408161 RepID=A0A6A7AUX9_9PLEO|nr:hypothetical protein T440DRAFT_472252 [Plenodomus tracheiphilus IPT5]
MENTTTATMERYTDSPPPRNTSPIKPHTSQHQPPPPYAYTDEEEPYHDDPPSHPHPQPQPRIQTHHIALPPPRPHPYTDLSHPPTPNDDDVPLAHLIPNPIPFPAHSPYPIDAPPPYTVAIHQAYHDTQTLIHYTPPHQLQTHGARHNSDAEEARQLELRLSRVFGDAVVDVDADEELGLGWGRGLDDVRHGVEKVVAMFVVAAFLLMVAGVLGWLALGSGVFV